MARPVEGKRPERVAVDEDHRVVAVTGGSSFLGSRLIQAMEEDRRYYKVLAIDVKKPTFPLAKTQFHRVDLTLPSAGAAVASVLKREGADTFVHLAFLSDFTHRQEWAHELESVGTMHALNACAECRIARYVHWSLTACYGAKATNPNYLTEDHPLPDMGESNFLADKIEAERQVAQFTRENPGASVTVLRTAPIVGPTISNFVTRYLSHRFVPTLLGYDPLIQLLHEQDAVDALKLVVDRRTDGVFNIVGRGVLPLVTALALMGRVPVPIPYSAAVSAARALWMAQLVNVPPGFMDFLRYLWVADGGKAARSLGWTSRYHLHDIIASVAGVERVAAVSGRDVSADRATRPSSLGRTSI
jgi:UDP-glucose 4-epimerase